MFVFPFLLKTGLCRTYLNVFIAFTFLTISPASAQTENLQELLNKVDSIRAPEKNFTFDVAVAAPNGTALELQVLVNERVKSLVRYVKPLKSRDRTLLFIEENMWVYVPGTRRPLRISPNQQILGGVSSADVARTVFDIDFKPVSITPTEADSRMKNWVEGSLRVMRLEARHSKTAYARIDLTINENARPYRAVFYSLSDRKLKTAYFYDYQPMLGELRPSKLMVIDHLNSDDKTELIYSNMTLRKTPANWFRPSYLPRLR